jgi:hypothetical protein
VSRPAWAAEEVASASSAPRRRRLRGTWFLLFAMAAGGLCGNFLVRGSVTVFWYAPAHAVSDRRRRHTARH